MRTRHILIIALALIVCFPVSLMSQNHSEIVEMKQTGPTTPKPRSQKIFSSSAYQNSSTIDKNAPGVWVDKAKKELCVRVMQEWPDCRLIIDNDNKSFSFQETVVTAGAINVYQLSDMEKPGVYTVTVLTSEKCYKGYYIYLPSNASL